MLDSRHFVIYNIGSRYIFDLSIRVFLRKAEMYREQKIKNTRTDIQRLIIYLSIKTILSHFQFSLVFVFKKHQKHGFLQSALYGFSASIGFSMVLIIFAAMRERIAVADVPMPFQGAAISLITAGLMSMAFMGFTGLVKI